MKKILIITCFLALSGCSFVKDIQNHCQVETKSIDTNNGSFVICATCDSLATVVKAQIAKVQK